MTNEKIDISGLEMLNDLLHKDSKQTMNFQSTGYTWTLTPVLAILLLLSSCTSKPTSITQRALPTQAVHEAEPTEPWKPTFTTFINVALTGVAIALVVDAIKLEVKWFFVKRG